jgi:hypothetical protein
MLLCLNADVCCELASTFNVLTWRVMPVCRSCYDCLFAWRCWSCELGCAFQPESLWSGVHHRRHCSAAERYSASSGRSAVSIEFFLAGIASPYRCNPYTLVTVFIAIKSWFFLCQQCHIPVDLSLGLEYGAFRFPLSRGATKVGIRAGLAIGRPSLRER